MKDKRVRTTLAFALYQEDFSSMLMAVGFALARSAYLALLSRAGIATSASGLSGVPCLQ